MVCGMETGTARNRLVAKRVPPVLARILLHEVARVPLARTEAAQQDGAASMSGRGRTPNGCVPPSGRCDAIRRRSLLWSAAARFGRRKWPMRGLIPRLAGGIHTTDRIRQLASHSAATSSRLPYRPTSGTSTVVSANQRAERPSRAVKRARKNASRLLTAVCIRLSAPRGKLQRLPRPLALCMLRMPLGAQYCNFPANANEPWQRASRYSARVDSRKRTKRRLAPAARSPHNSICVVPVKCVRPSPPPAPPPFPSRLREKNRRRHEHQRQPRGRRADEEGRHARQAQEVGRR
jgi:hypothetical protein